MAKSYNQKAKILFLAQMLGKTGEDQAVSMQEIIEALTAHGISAERKSIYDDLEALRAFGMDIQFKRGRPGGYYVAGKTSDTSMAVRIDFAEILRQSEENDPASEAADEAIEEPIEELIEESTEEVADRTGFGEFTPGSASGSKKMLKLLCTEEKREEICAYFGPNAEYREKENGMFQVTVPNTDTPEFFGWLTAMGRAVHITKPKKTATAYRDYLKALIKEYK